MIRAQVDVSQATAALWELQRRTKRPIETILRRELTAILRLAMTRTRAANTKSIAAAAEFRINRALKGRTAKGNRVTINIKKNRGRAWLVENGKTYNMTDGIYRWSDERFEDYLTADFSGSTTASPEMRAKVEKQLRAERKKLAARRGLAKQTWLILAREFGLTIDAPAYVRKATRGINSSGTNADNISARIIRSASRLTFEGTNSSPVALSPGARARAAITSAMRGRTRAVQDALTGGLSRAAIAIRKQYGLK